MPPKVLDKFITAYKLLGRCLRIKKQMILEKMMCHSSDISRQCMAIENQKPKPNEAIVTELMKLTFNQQRREILENASSVKDILGKFPFFHQIRFLTL